MNLYFLVEGRVTEMQVYASWMRILVPALTQVERLSDVRDNNFYMFSGYGYPSILRRIQGSVNDINRHGNIDYLVICVDSEDEDIDQRRHIINRRMKKLPQRLSSRTKLQIIVHHRCMETWFLGNMELQKDHYASGKLRRMIEDYDVFARDPEELVANHKLVECSTNAQYHYVYLKNLFRENQMTYTKKRPGRTTSRRYLRELIKRTQRTGDLRSFAYFIDFCRRVVREKKKREAIK